MNLATDSLLVDSRYRGRAARGVLAATFALLGLALAQPAAAYDIFILYVDGPNGGEIEIDGGSVPPPGTCGVRFHPPVEWYWAAGDYYVTGTLEDLPGNGVHVDQLSFSGPYEGCKQDPYLATTPASPGGWVPPGAIALVVQVHPEDVEWLDSHMHELPEAPEPPPDPPSPGDVCKLTPEFCGAASDYGSGICTNFPDSPLCDESDSEDMTLVRITDLAASVPYRVAPTSRFLAAGQNAAARRELELAQTWTRTILSQQTPLRDTHARLSRALAKGPMSAAIARALDGTRVGFELGMNCAARCDGELSRALTAVIRGRPIDEPSLSLACSSGRAPLASSRAWLGRLRAWAPPSR